MDPSDRKLSLMLTVGQVNELLRIIDRNQRVALGQELGEEWLTPEDIKTLEDHGIDVGTLYNPANDSLYTSFHLGLLAESLGQTATNKLTYPELKQYIAHGDYIPLTVREQGVLNSIRAQKFNDLKSLNSRIFTDVNQILLNGGLRAQREFLKQEIETGFLNRQTVRQIANEIGHKTGDWSRDFDRIVAYTSTLAFEEGKAAMIQRNAGEEDPLVYKTVFEGACKHCIRLYLTAGWGSQPRIFKLSELKANGTNIGVKTADWLPVLGPIHPYCRCALNYLPKGYVWDSKKKEFGPPKEGEKFVSKRQPIRVWIAGREQYV